MRKFAEQLSARHDMFTESDWIHSVLRENKVKLWVTLRESDRGSCSDPEQPSCKQGSWASNRTVGSFLFFQPTGPDFSPPHVQHEATDGGHTWSLLCPPSPHYGTVDMPAGSRCLGSVGPLAAVSSCDHSPCFRTLGEDHASKYRGEFCHSSSSDYSCGCSFYCYTRSFTPI